MDNFRENENIRENEISQNFAKYPLDEISQPKCKNDLSFNPTENLTDRQITGSKCKQTYISYSISEPKNTEHNRMHGKRKESQKMLSRK